MIKSSARPDSSSSGVEMTDTFSRTVSGRVFVMLNFNVR